MVEVIQRREMNWRVSCSKGCLSLLEVSESDLRVMIDFEGDATIFTVCPVCGVRVYGFRDIPLDIQRRLIEKAKGQ